MPGTSGLLTPFSKIDGLCFDNSDEPEDFFYKLDNDLKKFNKEHGIQYVKIDCDNPKDYYNIINQFQKKKKNDVSVYGTSRDGEMSIIVESDTSDETVNNI